MLVCSIVVRREIISVLDAGVDSSVGGEGAAATAVGELGAGLEVVCRLSEEMILIMFVAFLSAVRKSSTFGIVREHNETCLNDLTFVKGIFPL